MHLRGGLSSITLLLLAVSTLTIATDAQTDVDVCIIGAGPAGIGAALGLKKKGKTVRLIERYTIVGGQTSLSYTDPDSGRRLHMGAVVLTPPDYPHVMALAATVGLGVQPYLDSRIGTYFLPNNGVLARQPPLALIPSHPALNGTQLAAPAYLRYVAEDFPGFQAAMKQYASLRRSLLPLLLAPGGLPAVYRSAPQLAMNMDAWLNSHHLAVLIPLCAQMLIQTGYGHLYQTSTASGLLYLSPFVLLSGIGSGGMDVSGLITDDDTLGWPVTLYAFTDDVGFMELLRRLSLTLDSGTVVLSANITSLVRPPPSGPGADDPVRITYVTPSQQGSGTTVTCGALLNTVAQTIPNLSFLGLDATETELFNHVFYARYFTTALMVTPSLPRGVIALPLPRDGGYFTHPAGPAERALDNALHRTVPGSGMTPPAVPWLSASVDPFPYTGQVCAAFPTNPGASNRPAGAAYADDPSLFVAYSYSDVPVNASAVAAEAAKTFTRRSMKAQVRAEFEHVYYPRVSQADAQGGWWQQFDSIQGRRKTYHTGGLTTFWDVEHSLRSGLDAAARFDF